MTAVENFHHPPADTSQTEREIDEIVYKLYGLTKAVIKTMEKSLNHDL